MFTNTISKRMTAYRYFSTHCRVAIIGGGTAGMATSSQLAKSKNFKPEDIHVFDPKDEHHYQPSYTMIGGGVLGTTASEVRAKERTYVKRSMRSIFNTGVNLVKEKVESFDPENNKFTTNKGDYTYDYLVVAPGCALRFDKIEGAKEALDDPDHPVVSIYTEEYAYKTLKHRELLKEGTAIFYQPPNPIKCGGAPKKIMFLSASRWKDVKVKYVSALPVMFPPCEKFSIAINGVREKKNITADFHHVLKAIDKNAKVAIFDDKKNDKEVHMEYDFLHLAPPQKAPEFISNSVLAGAGGF